MSTLNRPADEIALALHSGVKLLGGDGTVDSMNCHLLSNLAEQTRAGDAVLWRYDFGADRYQFAVASSAPSAGGTRERSTAGIADWIQGLYPPVVRNQAARALDHGRIDRFTAEQLDSVAGSDRTRHWRSSRGIRSLAVLHLDVGEREIAAVSLAFREDEPLSQVEEALVRCLTSQLAVALAVERVAAAPGSVGPGASEVVEGRATRQSALTVAQVVDASANAAGELHDLDQLVPAVLRVVSRALGIHEGALWDGGAEGPMQLRYWLRDGSVLSPREVMELDGTPTLPLTYEIRRHDDDASERRPRQHPALTVVDHAESPGSTRLDAYLRRSGGSVELQAPLLIQGARIGALSIFRPAGQSFNESERQLTQSLARIVALAQQVARIASCTRVTTVARERLAMVNRASDTLRRTADKLAEVPALESFLEQVLESLVDTFSGCGGSLWWSDEGRVILSLEFEHGSMTCVAGKLHPNGLSLQTALQSSIGIAERVKSGMATVVDRTGLRSSPAVREWMQGLGVHTLLVVPLNLGRSHGCLSVRLAEPRTLGDEEVELAKVLSTQAALAMELTRLAEDAKDKATAEARSAELMKANDALRSTLDVVASGAETDVVLSHALRVIAEQFAGSGGSATLWLADDEARTQRPHLAFEGGEPVRPVLSRFLTKMRPVPLETDPLFRQHFIDGQASAVATDKLEPRQAAHLQALGVRYVVTLPMSLRGRPIGAFVVYVPSDAPEPSCERVELAQALAHQATLVLQLTRLAEQAKRAAVASERESAALVRAAEMTEANAALKRSLDVLASDADLDRFLGGLLREIGHRVDGNRVVLYLREEEGQDATSHLCWCDAHGVGKDPETLIGPEAGDALLAMVRSHSARRLPHIHIVGDITDTAPGQIDALQRASIQAILHLPLVLGERCLGAVIVLMSTPRILPSEELALVQAFAHQATLALHLARLSAQSQSVAILQERARLARELHDGIVQSFIGISMQLHQMRPAETCPAHERAAQLAEYGLAESRRAVKALRPLPLVSKAFTEAVTDMARTVIGAAATVKVTRSGEWTGLSPDTENHLFRLVQEAVNNVIKHAHATEVAIEFSAGAGEFSVLVSDNGIGFDVDAQGPERGFGLFSMHQRAESIGAKLAIVSAPGQGTQVFVSLERGLARPSA